MTKHKTFKRRIRERMEKTGESYTSARAALIGEQPPGVYPETSVLRFALAEAGTEISEGLALIIAGGAGAACMSFFYAEEDFSHFHLSGWNPFQSDVVKAVERLGLGADIHETTGAKTAAKALEERVESGIQIAWVEDYTVIAVVAVDEDHARIYDRSLKTITREEVAERRGRVRKQRHRLLQIGPGTPDLEKAVRQGLQACAHGPVKSPTPGMSLQGIARWADTLDTKWAQTFPAGKHRDGALTDMSDAITGQGGLLRRLQAQGLREAATLLGEPRLNAIAEQTNDNADAWLELARDHDLTRVRPLYERERAVVQNLEAMLT